MVLRKRGQEGTTQSGRHLSAGQESLGESFSVTLISTVIAPRGSTTAISPVSEGSLVSLTDSEDVSVGVAYVHLAHVPWLICRGPSYFEPLCDAVPVDSIHIIHPNRHPCTLVGAIVSFRTERHLKVALAASSLTVLAQKDLALAGTNSTEGRRITPVPSFLPPEFLEPRKTLANVGDVQNRSNALGLHSEILARPGQTLKGSKKPQDTERLN